MIRLMQRLAAVVGLAALCSCNYLADRGVDFIDQYRAAVGAGSVIGVRAKSLGLYDTGLMFGVKPRGAALGVRYGKVAFFNNRDSRIDADQAEVVRTHSLIGVDYGAGSYDLGRTSWAILPALLTWVDATPTDYDWKVPEEGEDYEDYHWLWSGYAFSNVRFAQVHAFDIEVELALLVYLDLGYSPGELLDFFLGIVFIDIAADDDRL